MRFEVQGKTLEMAGTYKVNGKTLTTMKVGEKEITE